MSLKVHDLECTNPGCGHQEINAMVRDGRISRCPRCRHKREIFYPPTRVPTRNVSVAPRERAVVWLNRETGSVAYPPVSDAVMPARYSSNGYERVEFTSLHSLDKFCKDRKLVNEVASFDRSGRSDDL